MPLPATVDLVTPPTERASIRLRHHGVLVEMIDGEGHLIEAMPRRTRYSRHELLDEADKLGWRFETEMVVAGTRGEVIFLFEHIV